LSSSKRSSTLLKIDWRTVGRRIRELRGFDVSQQDFAKRVGTTQAYLSKIEHGRVEVGAEILLRIARQYGRTIEWLLTGQNED
jgi:transcriptional regulator with XRE-family HTH domain